MKKFMILGASVLQLPAIQKAVQMGLDTIVVDMNPEAIGFLIPGVYKEVISTIDTAGVLAAAKRYHIDGIMTLASDMPMQTVAEVCRELKLVGISTDTALKATNKAFMRDALRAGGVPIPDYCRVRTKEACFKAVNELLRTSHQCIIKPADNSGSRGIFRIEEESNLNEAYIYSREFSRGGEIVVEEYMSGPEVSVETMAVDGNVHVIQITDKITNGSPYFVEMGHTQKSGLPAHVKAKIAEVAIAANHAIGIKNGPSHTEIIVTEDGPKIVELGARLGGDCITTHLVPLSTGVDMVEANIKIALGEEPDIRAKWDRGAAIRYINSEEGIVEAVSGLEEAEKVKGFVHAEIVHGVGDEIGKIRSSVDRVGFVICDGVNAAEAAEAAEKAVSMIRFKVKN